jgi:hypothetical protein
VGGWQVYWKNGMHKTGTQFGSVLYQPVKWWHPTKPVRRCSYTWTNKPAAGSHMRHTFLSSGGTPSWSTGPATADSCWRHTRSSCRGHADEKIMKSGGRQAGGRAGGQLLTHTGTCTKAFTQWRALLVQQIGWWIPLLMPVPRSQHNAQQATKPCTYAICKRLLRSFTLLSLRVKLSLA